MLLHVFACQGHVWLHEEAIVNTGYLSRSLSTLLSESLSLNLKVISLVRHITGYHFHVGTRVLNLTPHVNSARPLPTEPFPRPSGGVPVSFVCDGSLFKCLSLLLTLLTRVDSPQHSWPPAVSRVRD